MNVVFMFRRLVFVQVMLGMVAFCLAEPPHGNPALLLVVGTLCVLSWYVAEGPGGKPLPQWLINIGAMLAIAWLGVDLVLRRRPIIVGMCHFTMWLQILQLYGHKKNREYALILVLSLLQMVGASILSVTMLFGILLFAYCVVGLLTVLLFQFKVTSDEILTSSRLAATRRGSVSRPKPVVCRGHRWQFRLVAGFVGSVAAIIALACFVLLPRTSRFANNPLLAGLQPSQVGYNDRVDLSGAPPTIDNREPVLHLEMKGDVGDQHHLLRGAALDRYDRRTRSWVRGTDIGRADQAIMLDTAAYFGETQFEGDAVDATVTLRNNRRQTLFTLNPVTRFSSPSLHSVKFNPFDQRFNSDAAANKVLVYRLQSPASHQVRVTPRLLPRFEWRQDDDGNRWRFLSPDQAYFSYARGWEVEQEWLSQYTLNILRETLNEPHLTRNVDVVYVPRDFEFARVLEQYLQSRFTYTLTNHPSRSRDPIVEFLDTERQGHCELFASALAAMTRSIGMRARVVTGYRASEYNSIGDYYLVREGNAHAWTEIDCGAMGWQTFDATPPGDVAAEHAVSRSWLSGISDLYGHLEYLWIDTFVAYDKETRDEVLSNIGQSIRESTANRESFIGGIVGWFGDMIERWRLNQFSFSVMVITFVFICIGVGSLVRMKVLRRKRMVALQLTKLPRPERMRLAQRLSFYLDMLDLLERNGHVRPDWQSPFGFATELNHVDMPKFKPVLSLTEHFYEIRFGHRESDTARQDRIRALLKELEHNLAGRKEAA